MELLSHLLLRLTESLPRLMGALLILLVGWVLAKSAAAFARQLLKKMQLDRLTDRLNEIDIIHRSNVRIELSGLLSTLLYYLLLLVSIVAATDVLGMPALSQLMQDVIAYLPRLVTAMAIVLIGTLLADMLRNMVLSAGESLGIPSIRLIAAFVFYFVFLSVLLSALSQAGVDTRFITANISILLAGGVLAFSIGYGIASRDVVANFLASFYSNERFRVGDRITVDGISGTIIEIDHSSLVLQAEGKKIIIPLSKLTNSSIEVHETS